MESVMYSVIECADSVSVAMQHGCGVDDSCGGIGTPSYLGTLGNYLVT